MAQRRLPSLRGMQAFEAAARLGSLTAAAEELSITHSAVSHRIRGLERELGLKLFSRQARGVALTAAGRRYIALVGDAFDLLARAAEEVGMPDLSGKLTVSLTEQLGSRWLIPRWHRLREVHPDLEIALLTTERAVDLLGGEADVALRYGRGDWPGLRAELLLRFDVFPVCAPSLAGTQKPLRVPQDLARHTIIRSDGDDWDAWLAAAGVPGLKPAESIHFARYSMAIAAAKDGHGIALGYLGEAELELAAGYLVQPFRLIAPADGAYYLVFPERRPPDPRVQKFRDWILSERDPSES